MSRLHRGSTRKLSLSALVLSAGAACSAGPVGGVTPTQGFDGNKPHVNSNPTKDDLPTLRRALAGEPLSDAEVLFVHQSLLASKSPYTERGLATYAEWSLVAQVKRVGTSLELFVAGPKVNAEWNLTIDASGAVKQGTVFQLD